jgi:hypothetical protein
MLTACQLPATTIHYNQQALLIEGSKNMLLMLFWAFKKVGLAPGKGFDKKVLRIG